MNSTAGARGVSVFAWGHGCVHAARHAVPYSVPSWALHKELGLHCTFPTHPCTQRPGRHHSLRCPPAQTLAQCLPRRWRRPGHHLTTPASHLCAGPCRILVDGKVLLHFPQLGLPACAPDAGAGCGPATPAQQWARRRQSAQHSLRPLLTRCAVLCRLLHNPRGAA